MPTAFTILITPVSYTHLFLLLNVWLGGTFYFWVRHIEAGTNDPSMVRPAGVEGWLPIAGLMNLKYWLTTGRVPASHPAALFLLVTFLAIAFLLRKEMCIRDRFCTVQLCMRIALEESLTYMAGEPP